MKQRCQLVGLSRARTGLSNVTNVAKKRGKRSFIIFRLSKTLQIRFQTRHILYDVHNVQSTAPAQRHATPSVSVIVYYLQRFTSISINRKIYTVLYRFTFVQLCFRYRNLSALRRPANFSFDTNLVPSRSQANPLLRYFSSLRRKTINN